jgi:hypothetical protein
LQRHPGRWIAAARFLGSAVSLWAACAAGISLIGPGESALVADAAPQAGQVPAARTLITTAAYHP